MLKIQVLGRGLIPRGHGIAPKMEPFPANVMLIGTILSTPGLQVNFIHPETNKAVPLTRANYQKIYQTWRNVAPGPRVATEPQEAKGDGVIKQGIELQAAALNVPGVLTGISLPADGVSREVTIEPTATPVIPVPVVTTPEVKVEAKIETPVEKVEAAAKTEEFTMKPIMSPDEKTSVNVNTQNNRQQYNNNQNNRR